MQDNSKRAAMLLNLLERFGSPCISGFETKILLNLLLDFLVHEQAQDYAGSIRILK